MSEDQTIDIWKVILLIYNCSIHTFKKTTDFLNGLGWRTVFLPPNSPECSPIELLFNFLKSKVWKHWKGNSINISKESGWRVIKKWAVLFNHDMIIVYKMNQTNENDSVIIIGSPNFINEESYKIRNIIFQLGIRNNRWESNITKKRIQYN